MQDQALKDKAVRGVIWYGGSRAIIQLLSWVLTIAVARVLVPEDYGLFGMCSVYTGLVDFLNELGFGAAIVQRKEVSEDDLHTLFWFGVVVSLLIYGLTYLVAPLVAVFYRHEQVTPVLRALGLVFILTNLRLVPWNLLTRAVDFKRRSILEVVGNMLGVVSTFLLARAGWGVWSLVLGVLIREAVLCVLVFAQSHWRPRFKFAWVNLRELSSFSLNLSAARIAWYLYDNSDRLIIGRYLGDQTLGYYTLATRLTTELSGRVLSIINQVAFPVYSRLQDDHDRLKSYFLTSVQLACLVIVPVLAGLSLVSGDVIPLLLKPKWAPMIPALNIMCWAAMIMMINSLSGPLLLAKGKTGLLLKFNLLNLAVMPPVFYFAARSGLQAICLVWLLVFPVLALVWIAAVKRCVVFHWSELGEALRPAFVSTAVMVLTVFLPQITILKSLGPVPRTAIETVLGIGGYVACLLLLFPQPLQNILQFVRRRKSEVTAVIA
ncbi:MAG TPA: lipopolysaccharide biosynthesis protein [Verrucomicrobiae bacterium]|nr:lipopolysaccharide biosynthesis protein [Verrucomicrobiae bacterium]